MKKLYYSIGVIASTVLALASCQKQDVVQESESKLVNITFTAEKAGMDTRTAAVEGESEVSYIWTDNDINNIKLFQKESDGTYSEFASPKITKVSDTQLTISAEVESNATYTFFAILSNEYTGSGSYGRTDASSTSYRKPRMKSKQAPDGISNIDPDADILVSDDMEVTVSEDETSTGDMLLTFRRQVAVNKMTLKNMVAGEKVSKVVITSSTELTGYYDIVNQTTTGQYKVLTLEYSDVEVPESGQFPVYFVAMESTGHSLSIEVTTDQNTYSKSFAEGKTIDFAKGSFTRFNVALPEGTANQSLSLPFEDDMSWADNGETDGSSALTSADLTVADSEGNKYYSDASYCYKGIGGLKLGTGNYRGSIVTSDIDLSSTYTIVVSAKAWGTDESQLEVSVDGTVIGTTDNLYNEYVEYTFAPESVATNTSKVTFKITGKRGYINSIKIVSGQTYSPKPVIIIDGDVERSVGTSESEGAISYEVVNAVDGQSLNASCNVSWITIENDDNEISYTVEANTEDERTGIITLSYEGAESKTVKITQSAYVDPSQAIEYSFTITASDFNSTSYAANNNEKTSTATATDGSGKTIEVAWTSYQVMMNSSNMQWQKSKGYIYNSTDLGTITDVTVTSTAGTFTTVIGSSQQPTAAVEGGGFFKVSVGSTTGTSSKITVTFKK